MWSDVAQTWTCGLRAHLPWILLVGGLLAQLAGARILAGRAQAVVSRQTEVAEHSDPVPMSDSEKLPPLETPIAGAHVPTNPALLPGARREYRGGAHEGIDFSCSPGTPVRAAAAGWVLSIDDEPNLPEARRTEILRYCQQLGRTPAEVLQVLHGRRVILCHGMYDGRLLTTSYSHLASIRSALKPGSRVQQGEALGESGASGTSHAYADDGWGEVHFEIRLNGVPLGSDMLPQEAGALYREVLSAEIPR